MTRILIVAIALAACTESPTAVVNQSTPPTPVLSAAIQNQVLTVGGQFSLSFAHCFTGDSLHFTFALPPGLTVAGTSISGVPTSPGVYASRVTAINSRGDSVSTQFSVIVFAAGLSAPALPATPFAYSDASNPLARWYSTAGNVTGADNMTATNPTTDAGAALGRVLFYDKRLSSTDKIACASCHKQQFGFADNVALSPGVNGVTDRHSMALGNARFYMRGRFFWDERAATLEDQVLQPIQNPVEMGMTLPNLVSKLNATPYYAALFNSAFGTSEITTDRISRALAQFVRSLVTSDSRFDATFANGNQPNVALLTPQEAQGFQLFNQSGCDQCHGTNANISDNIHNNGLDATITDAGAGNGRFKAPSLRNVAVRAPYMHDGRFHTLEEVVAFYNNGVQNNPGLDGRLRIQGGGGVKRLNLNGQQQAAMVAYLRALTDSTFLTAPKFASPFPN